MKDYREKAYYIRDELGGQCVPLSTTKTPSIKWKHLQTNRLTNEEIEKHCKSCSGLALLTGLELSPFFCIDLDLKNQLPHQDYHSAVIERLSDQHDTSKFYINQTQSKVGLHYWFKVPKDLQDKSRKLVTRGLTVPEISKRYEDALSLGADPVKTSSKLLSNPTTCVIESRMTNSYGVFESDKYTHLQGDTPPQITTQQYWDIIETLYSMDHFFSLPAYYTGKVKDYRYIKEFCEGVSAEELLDIVLSTGLFTDAGSNHNGDLKFKSTTSNNPHSGYIFKESKFLFCFSFNTIFGEGKFPPNKVVQICNSFTDQETLEYCVNWCEGNGVDMTTNYSKPKFKF